MRLIGPGSKACGSRTYVHVTSMLSETLLVSTNITDSMKVPIKTVRCEKCFTKPQQTAMLTPCTASLFTCRRASSVTNSYARRQSWGIALHNGTSVHTTPLEIGPEPKIWH